MIFADIILSLILSYQNRNVSSAFLQTGLFKDFIIQLGRLCQLIMYAKRPSRGAKLLDMPYATLWRISRLVDDKNCENLINIRWQCCQDKQLHSNTTSQRRLAQCHKQVRVLIARPLPVLITSLI